MNKLWGIIVLSGALLLAGCAGGQAAPSASPTPTQEVASEAQVGSVIAKYESDWLEVIDNAGSCRLQWVLHPDSAQSAACYAREKTMILTAQSAINDLHALKVPSSMQSLVDDTVTALGKVTAVRLTALCGDGATPTSTDACTAALGDLNRAYVTLKSELNAWGPYTH